jgi:hypothetical protein
MNDEALFDLFVQNTLGETLARTRNSITSFIPTFHVLLNTTDQEINTFVSNTHSSNSGRGVNAKIIISPSTVIGLQSLRFELKDRQLCNCLPDAATLEGINIEQLAILREARSQALEQEKNRSDNNTQGDLVIPKFTIDNFDEFMVAFTNKAKRQIGVNKLPIDYVIRTNTEPGNYMALYASREEKLKNCIHLHGDNFQIDNDAIYSMYVQHIGTADIGSSIVNRFNISRNGRQCHLDFITHYANETHLENKATEANNILRHTVYLGVRRNFNIETYYNRMSSAFNKLSKCGPAHHLSEVQKVQQFDSNLKEPDALKFAISARKTWNNLPDHSRTFDSYYNIFSADLSKLHKLTDNAPQSYNRRINNTNTSIMNQNTYQPPRLGGRGGRGGRGRNNFRGGGRGRGGRFNQRGGRYGRGGRHQHNRNRFNNNNNFAPLYGNFNPEAKVYDPAIFQNLTYAQKQSIADLKASQGWINSMTPPPGFTIDSNTGQAIPSKAIISAIQTASINQISLPPPTVAPLPPPPPPFIQIPPPPPFTPSEVPRQQNDNNYGQQAGANFGRQGTRNRDTPSVISAVSINGQPYNGQIYDRNGNVLN